MTAPAPQSQPEGEYANWTLHRQPEDQVVDHRFSLWSGEHPVVLANEMPGEEGALAYIASELNSAATLQARVDELTKALDQLLNDKHTTYAVRCMKARETLAMPLERSGGAT